MDLVWLIMVRLIYFLYFNNIIFDYYFTYLPE